jgi:acyl-CoA thioesterase FadM/phosphopantetheinyl transferase (holo-ACP synthase)
MDQEYNMHRSIIESDIKYRIFKHHDEFGSIDKSNRHAIEDAVFHSMKTELQILTDGNENKIIRSANGKPAIENSKLKISISHSRSVLLVTTGLDDQGCDIEFVEKRTPGEWDDLLESKFGNVMKQLDEIDHNTNVSATRLWCVKEALIKSYGTVPLNIIIEKVQGNGIIFKAMTSDQNYRMVLTFPVNVLPANSFIVSMVIKLKKEGDIQEKSILPENKDSSSLFMNDKGRFSFSFLTTFKDCKGFYGKTHFSNFPDWMGVVRELVLSPIGNSLLSDLGSGQFGMVTNTSEIRILHETEALNDITGYLWITEKSDLINSFIDLYFEFVKIHPVTGTILKLAECNLSTTWVKIEGRGIVKKSPIPDYFMRFLNAYIRPVRSNDQFLNDRKYPAISDLGKRIYESAEGIRPQILLDKREFHTGLTNGNTVGNLYYSNYYHWQAETIEQYLFHQIPDVLTGNGTKGEFLTIACQVNHLQEAMPFELILVNMYIEKMYENGMKFYFEYYSKQGSAKRKLAFGSNTLIWCKRPSEKSVPVAVRIPEKITGSIMSMISL